MSQAWSVCIELDSSDPTAETIEALHQALTPHAPSVGQAPSGKLSVRLFVEADDAPEANTVALGLVTAAAHEHGVNDRVTGIQVMTEDELDRYIASSPVPPLAGITEIATICDTSSKQRAKQLTELKGFPAPVQTLAAGPVYIAQQVAHWNTNRSRSRWPAPAQLTEAERAVLLALVAAGRGEELPDTTDVQQRTIHAVEETYSPTHMRLHLVPSVTDDILQALSALSDKSLVTTRQPPQKITSNAEHKDDTIVAITPKGQRRATSIG
ncbi:hypothetical protein [Streptomyces sp. NPDC020667]|uniref:hypothetical protein n=1 Tax=Streptomyces sp. NPDC020667 TaxID=3154895 RepID=UPI00340FDC93